MTVHSVTRLQGTSSILQWITTGSMKGICQIFLTCVREGVLAHKAHVEIAVDVKVFFLTHLFETRSLFEPEAKHSSQSGWPVRPRDLLVSTTQG